MTQAVCNSTLPYSEVNQVCALDGKLAGLHGHKGGKGYEVQP